MFQKTNTCFITMEVFFSPSCSFTTTIPDTSVFTFFKVCICVIPPTHTHLLLDLGAAKPPLLRWAHVTGVTVSHTLNTRVGAAASHRRLLTSVPRKGSRRKVLLFPPHTAVLSFSLRYVIACAAAPWGLKWSGKWGYEYFISELSPVLVILNFLHQTASRGGFNVVYF